VIATSEITDTISPLKALELALQHVAERGGTKRETDFKEAYPLIEQHLAGKLQQKVLLESFNAAYGHKVHPPGFRKMLEAERKRRSKSGEDATCGACGQRLHTACGVADESSSETT